MANFDIVEDSLKDSLLKKIEQIEDEKRKDYINRLKQKLQDIQNISEIDKKEKNTRIKWSQIIDNSYSITGIKKNQTEQDLIKVIINAYREILNILSEVEIINKVSFSITYISDNYQYARLEGDLSVENFSLQRTSKKKGRKYAIRINEATLKEQIEQARKKENFQKLNTHFQNYIQVFRNWEQKQQNGTQWKINKGVLAETFERHLENQRGKESFEDSDFQSEGRRWTMYRESSGSDPFWTGPDTEYAQVKTTKASLISNIDTVLNALYGIIEMFEYPEKLNEEILENIFKQKGIKNEIQDTIWESLDEMAQNTLKEELQDLGFQEIVVYNKTGRKRKNTYISL